VIISKSASKKTPSQTQKAIESAIQSPEDQTKVDNSEVPAQSSQEQFAKLTVTYEERIFEIQAKFTYGLMTFLDNQRGQGFSKDQFNQLKSTIGESFEQALGAPSANSVSKSELFFVKEIIFFDALDLVGARNSACRKALSSDGKVSSADLMLVINNICLAQKPPVQNETETKKLKEKLGWFYDVYVAPRNSDSRLKLVSAETKASSHSTMIRVGAALVVGFILGTISFFLSTYFLFKLILRKAKFGFEIPKIPSEYCLEIFFIYMLSMNLLPIALRLPELRPYLLPINGIAITSFSLIVLWPCFFSQDLSDILDSLGLRIGGIGKLLRDTFVGIISYVAAMIPVLLVLTLYSFVLVLFEVDVSSGTHPIVPILTESKSDSTIIWIMLLAVVVAPFVEEIMFRGALYSWLRARSGAAVSIFVSSFIFAMIHPQGLIGIVPLTCIGVVLALIREWRGNLTSCMIAHACFNGGTLLIALNLLR
jgi:membrane protease YdiL (CAAX protease family)